MCGTSQVNPSLPLYQLCCSVCKLQFFGRGIWLRHLTQDDHQNLARLECLEKWDGELRKCSLLLFTSKNLSQRNGREIVKHFSNVIKETVVLVTDFVWWEDRPQLGILQFESQGKAYDVLKQLEDCNGSSTILIGNCQNFSVQLRAGSELKEFEWNSILPQRKTPVIPLPPIEENHQAETGQNNGNAPRAVTLTLEPERMESDPMLPSAKRIKLEESSGNTTCISNRDDTSNIGSILNLHPLRSDQPPPPFMNSASHPLQFEYWTIRKAILIPDNQYQQAMEAVSQLKNVISKMDPKLETHVFRNWYLKLDFPAKQELQLFVHKPCERSSSTLLLNLRKVLGLECSKSTFQFSLLKKRSENEGFLEINYFPTKLIVSLITPKREGSLMEFQVCRLLEYMCEFDPRCHTLITLAHYWVSINSIDICGTSCQPGGSSLELPSHYSIQWLVMFFLSHGNYIPSPHQIQRESSTKDLDLIDDLTRTTIGFTWDPSYIRYWKQKRKTANTDSRRDYCAPEDENSEEFLFSCLKLFRNFLHFCSCTLGNPKNWLLDTFHGQLIDVDSLSGNGTGKQNSRWKRVVRERDIIKLEKVVEMEKRLKHGRFELLMTHPFVLTRKISLSNDIKVKFKGLSTVDAKMIKFFEEIEQHGVSATLKKGFTLRSLLIN